MNYKQRATLLIILVAAVCGLAIWGVARWRYSGLHTTAEWLERLPTQDSIVFYADVAALRRAGILRAGSKVAEEPEYKVFVMQTGFDYTRDLDAVVASFTPTAKYFVVKGHFNWDTLRAYAHDQGGACHNLLCRMNGSTPERKISYFPLRANLMGLAVSPDESAAVELESAAAHRRRIETPDAPLWISIPPAWFKNTESLPPGTRMFADTMKNSDQVGIALAPKGERYEAQLNIQCHDEQQAALLAEQLQRITALLRDLITREKQTPNPRDLSGVLTSGWFQHTGARVVGGWPLEKGFIDDLLGGS